jgi:hypothetical protein
MLDRLTQMPSNWNTACGDLHFGVVSDRAEENNLVHAFAWLSSRFPTATLWFLERFDRLIKWIGDWGSQESLCRPVAFGGGAKRPRKVVRTPVLNSYFRFARFLESFPPFEALFVRNFPLQNCESEQL